MGGYDKRYVPCLLAIANAIRSLLSRLPEALWRILGSREILPGLEQTLGPVPPVGDEVVDLAVAPAPKLVQYWHAPGRVGFDLHVEPVKDDLLLVDALARREVVPRREELGEGIDHWRLPRQLDILPEVERVDKVECAERAEEAGTRSARGIAASAGYLQRPWVFLRRWPDKLYS